MSHALLLLFEVSLIYLAVSGLCGGLWIAFALWELERKQARLNRAQPARHGPQSILSSLT
jgi:hypothetical protein